MSLEKILAISKKPGLFKLVNPSRGGYIVTSMLDQRRSFVKMDKNLSLLSEISVYTFEGELPLVDVFKKIFKKEDGKKTAVKPRASKDALKAYFFSVLPDFDEDRVYLSDIKKIIKWYNLLVEDGFDFQCQEQASES
ncbi:MAG: DUF5606 domain-containing protein [Bacteroidota bacterium]|nr:DUF5606 domain-containing protein [Bacteroidota bacterium]